MKRKMEYNEIEQKVIHRTTPSGEFRKKTKETVKKIRKRIEKEISRENLPVEIELVGSTAKDTYLEGNMDIDFFLVYPIHFSKKEIAEKTLKIAERILENTEHSYAEHPYLKGFFNNFEVEIVPCYHVEEARNKISAVDRTPYHTSFVQKNLREEQKADVRLLKQFLKGIGSYGAEAEIQGFSGYLCEILIIKYQSFRELLKKTKHWKPYGTTISLDDKKHPEFDEPLVFVDPVDSERNVASAVAEETLKLFIQASQEYLSSPRKTFFFPNPVKPWSIEKIKETLQKQKDQYIGIKFPKPDIIDENFYPQLRKACRAINQGLAENDFNVKDITYYAADSEEVYIIVKLENRSLSETKLHMGPPLDQEQHVQRFLEKWRNHPRLAEDPFEKNNRIYVEIKRRYTKVEDFLQNNLEDFSLGKNLDHIIDKKYEILSVEDLVRDKLRKFWTKYLDGKKPWER
ncbi:MAG: CCA tRNA nucleotidyltransferase [Candidatus Thermoplasmatota archaeon]